MTQPGRQTAWAFIVFFSLMSLAPLASNEFWLILATKILAFALFAISLDLLLGFAGLVSLGHAAFFGIGAYAAMMLAPEYDSANMLVTLPLSVLAAMIAALMIGALVIRTSGMYFIMVTLAFGQMAFFAVHDSPWFGGSDGVLLFARPVIAFGEILIIDLQDSVVFFYTAMSIVAVSALIIAMLLRTSFGSILRGIADDEERMRALGIQTNVFKLAAFTISGAAAGLAGYIAAYQAEYVSPALLGWHESGLVLMMVILGGRGTLAGPAFGALVLIVAQELFQNFTGHWMALLGVFVVSIVLFLPNGVVGGFLKRRPTMVPPA